ncbi:hypothetical protein Gpo141_00009838 [Globisporangium polare]
MFELAQHFWVPWTLLMSFSIFQYLVTVYLTRRRERRVALLIASAFLGFASLTLFSNSDEDVVNRMDDISEVCCVLTFLTQSTIIGSDVTRKVRVPSLRWMAHIAELSLLADLASLVSEETLNALDTVVESLSLLRARVHRQSRFEKSSEAAATTVGRKSTWRT